MSVTKNKDKTWTAQVWYKDFTGKRRHTTKSGFKRKQDAEKWEREFKMSDHPQEITIGELIDKFVENCETLCALGNLKNTTVQRKQNYINIYIKPYFKNTIASKVTTDNINTWLKKIVSTSKVHKRLSSGTANSARGILSQIFALGVRKYGLESNPVDEAEHVKYFSNNTRAEMWTPEEFTRFYESLNFIELKMLFLTIYLSGLRIGEALALTPADISQTEITVNKAVTYVRGQGDVISTPKTSTSIRQVLIPDDLYKALSGYISTLPNIKPTDRIFMIQRTRATSALHYHMTKLGLPKISAHTLRHSYASLLYSKCKDIAVVSKQLGHANSKITLGIYTHMIEEENKKAVEKMNNILDLN